MHRLAPLSLGKSKHGKGERSPARPPVCPPHAGGHRLASSQPATPAPARPPSSSRFLSFPPGPQGSVMSATPCPARFPTWRGGDIHACVFSTLPTPTRPPRLPGPVPAAPVPARSAGPPRAWLPARGGARWPRLLPGARRGLRVGSLPPCVSRGSGRYMWGARTLTEGARACTRVRARKWGFVREEALSWPGQGWAAPSGVCVSGGRAT